MKITFSVWVSENEHFTQKSNVDWWHKEDLIKAFISAIELLQLRVENHKLKNKLKAIPEEGK